ncbi:uncharacterized protein LOC108024448 [Drosophila biarmipes]|uniref:uncharacterized protein LOC108024448 n=1 Tax=Drosophila biarmipes TaxID=125945 RepID=UPI0007E74BC3|nr:uncharacterized protein LOC108024448 [Drosophila biarmipes]
MHSLLVCVSALCFCQLFEGAIGSGSGRGTLCKDCRVNVINPAAGIPPPELPKNHKIVRIINEYKRISREELEYRNEIRRLRLQSKEFSFIAKLKVGKAIRCSAALVAPSVVITSSTCFLKEAPSQTEIILQGGRAFKVDSVVKPDWCPELSLLHLKSPSENQPINPCHGDLPLGINASMVMASPDLSFYARRRTQIISNRACKTTFLEDDSVFVTPNMMCALNSPKPEKCATSPGDSLLIDHQLCGLNIYGFRCFVNTTNGDLYINLAKLQPMLSDLIRQLNG